MYWIDTVIPLAGILLLLTAIGFFLRMIIWKQRFQANELRIDEAVDMLTAELLARLRAGKKAIQPLDNIYIPGGGYTVIWHAVRWLRSWDDEQVTNQLLAMDHQLVKEWESRQEMKNLYDRGHDVSNPDTGEVDP